LGHWEILRPDILAVCYGENPIRGVEEHREALSNIREFWIELAQKSEFLSDDALATQIETIGRIHARFRS